MKTITKIETNILHRSTTKKHKENNHSNI